MAFCCRNKQTPEAKQDERFTKELIQEGRIRDREVKLLLLGDLTLTSGSGDSGKSTIAKQMKILHLNGFTENELLVYKPVVISNTLQSLKALIQAAQKFGLTFQGNNQVLSVLTSDAE